MIGTAEATGGATAGITATGDDPLTGASAGTIAANGGAHAVATARHMVAAVVRECRDMKLPHLPVRAKKNAKRPFAI
jgi:hypothetical protein